MRRRRGSSNGWLSLFNQSTQASFAKELRYRQIKRAESVALHECVRTHVGTLGATQRAQLRLVLGVECRAPAPANANALNVVQVSAFVNERWLHALTAASHLLSGVLWAQLRSRQTLPNARELIEPNYELDPAAEPAKLLPPEPNSTQRHLTRPLRPDERCRTSVQAALSKSRDSLTASPSPPGLLYPATGNIQRRGYRNTATFNFSLAASNARHHLK